MSNAPQPPSDTEFQAFLSKLTDYRATLAEGEQKLLDAMVAAALGQGQGSGDEEVKPYWVATVNPAGPAGGVGYGATVYTPYGAAGYNTTPWGTAYGRVYY